MEHECRWSEIRETGEHLQKKKKMTTFSHTGDILPEPRFDLVTIVAMIHGSSQLRYVTTHYRIFIFSRNYVYSVIMHMSWYFPASTCKLTSALNVCSISFGDFSLHYVTIFKDL